MPCVFDADHWYCRLNVEGPGHLVVDLDEGLHAYRRTLRARWAGASGLVDELGAPILGWTSSGDGVPSGTLAPTPIAASLPPRATSTVSLVVNLDATSPVSAVAFDVNDVAGTSSFSTSVTVFDSRGWAHQVDLAFAQTDLGQWTWHAIVAMGELDGSTSTSPVVVSSGMITFDTNGVMSSSVAAGPMTLTFFGADPQDLMFDFGTLGGGGSTSFGVASALFYVEQDGYGPGWVDNVAVDQRGHLVAIYTNGRALVVGKLALAAFESPSSLRRIAPHVWLETPESGPPVFGPEPYGTIIGWTLATP